MKGRNYVGYVRVHEDAVKTKRELDTWVDLALDFNARAKASPPTAISWRPFGTIGVERWRRVLSF